MTVTEEEVCQLPHEPGMTCRCGHEEPGSNLPEVVHKTVAALELPITEFEGEMVRKMVGKVKVPDLDMPVGYRRNTHLKLEMEVRVREVSHREVGPSNDRHLVREHVLVVEDSQIKLLGAYTADEVDPGVGGSAAAIGNDLEENGDENDPGF